MRRISTIEPLYCYYIPKKKKSIIKHNVCGPVRSVSRANNSNSPLVTGKETREGRCRDREITQGVNSREGKEAIPTSEESNFWADTEWSTWGYYRSQLQQPWFECEDNGNLSKEKITMRSRISINQELDVVPQNTPAKIKKNSWQRK